MKSFPGRSFAKHFFGWLCVVRWSRRRTALFAIGALASLGIDAALGPASAAPDASLPAVLSATVSPLIKLFVVALLLESGLAAIFNWRVFLAIFDGRGWKTIFMVAASWLLVVSIPIPWLADLFNGYGGDIKSDDTMVRLLTALVLAGGSSGIYNLLVMLGYRMPVSIETLQPKPPPAKAWVSVTVKRMRAKGPIDVFLTQSTPQPASLPPEHVGFVGGGDWGAELKGLFFRNRMRFPRSAGHEVEPGAAYELLVRATDGTSPIFSTVDGTYVFARGAIIDLFVTL